MSKNYLIKIFCIIIHFYILQNIFSLENNFDEEYISKFLESQLFEIQDYQNQIFQEKIYSEKYNQLKNKWMPNFYISTGTGYSYDSDYQIKNPHEFYYSNKLNFSQKLPLGISFDAELFSFSGNLDKDKILHTFDYLGSLQFAVPVMSYLLGFTDDLIFIEKNETQNYLNYTTIGSKITKKQIANFLKENIGRYLYNFELVNFYSAKEKVLTQKQNDIEKMFLEGQLSFSELINVKNEILQNSDLYNNSIYELNQIVTLLENSGCDVSQIKFDLQDWILYCSKNENSICDDFINFDYQFLQLQSQWINNVKSYNQSFPNLYISFSTIPTGTERNYFEENLSSLESFSYYWSTVDSCQINLSLSMKINLMSYDDVFVNKKILEVEKQLFEQNLSLLSKKRIEETQRRNKNYQYYFSLSENAKIIYFQEKEIFASHEKMYQNSLISKYDYLSSKFYLQQLYFDYVEKYLNYYSFLLSCF